MPVLNLLENNRHPHYAMKKVFKTMPLISSIQWRPVMKKTGYAMLAIVLCMMLIPALTAEGGNEKPLFYQLLWQSDNVTGTIYINGFAITTLNGMSGSGSAALNVWLTGSNEIRAEVARADKSSESSFSLGVSKMVPGDMVDTTGKGNLFSVEKKDADFAGEKPVTISKKFQSAIDFSGHLNSSQNADDKAIIAYAVKIHQLFAKKDMAGIMKEFSVKVEDYSKAFSRSDMAVDFESGMKEMLKNKLEKIELSKLKAVKEGPGGCVWHVLEGGRELIRMSDPDGGTSEISVYIGAVNGVLKVVR
jgi:hypothetical protein